MTLTAPERADIAEAAEKLGGAFSCNICGALPWSDGTFHHTPDCLVTKLRAIVARENP